MPDTDDHFAPLVRDVNRVVFAVPEEVRRRGSRRRLSRGLGMAALAAVVVAVIALGSTWVIGRPTLMPPGQSPSPTVSTAPPTTEPTSVDIPLQALLQATDVGTGYATADGQQGDDHGAIGMMMSYCGESDYSTAFEHRLANHKRSVGQSDQRYVLEEVSRYEATWAARHLSDLRAALPRCQMVDVLGDQNHRVTLTVVGSDFAGDESVLIRETFGNETQYHAVVRRGDVEARLRIHTGATESEARAIVVKAGERLCAAVPSC